MRPAQLAVLARRAGIELDPESALESPRHPLEVVHELVVADDRRVSISHLERESGPCWARTSDPQLVELVLSQLS